MDVSFLASEYFALLNCSLFDYRFPFHVLCFSFCVLLLVLGHTDVAHYHCGVIRACHLRQLIDRSPQRLPGNRFFNRLLAATLSDIWAIDANLRYVFTLPSFGN